MRMFLILTLWMSSGWALADAPNCPQGHCSNVAEEMNRFCIANGMAGKPFLVFGPDGGMCYCPCSCVSEDTLFSLSTLEEKPLSQIQEGEAMLTPLSGESSGNLDRKLASHINDGLVHRLTFSNGSEITASDNHVFVTPEETTITAAELTSGAEILDIDGHAVSVISNIRDEHFTGSLMNVIVNGTLSGASHHLISANGLMSGDWLLQAHSDMVGFSVDLHMADVTVYEIPAVK